MEKEFPIYRKLANNRSFYKITSKEAFEEIQIFGSSFSIHRVIAKIHPDRVLIKDMIDCRGGHWQISNEKEYQRTLKHSEKELKQVG